MATLYKLTGDLLAIQQMVEDGAENLEDTLESIELGAAEKLEGYAMVIKNIQSDIDGLKAEEKRLAERRKSMENNVDRMKQAMAATLQILEGNRLKTEKFTFSFRKSKAVEIENAALIPKQFKVLEEKVLKAEIKKALTDGLQVSGASLVENQSLSIR